MTLSIRQKILMILFAAVVGFVIYFATNIWSIQQSKGNLGLLSERHYPALQEIKNAVSQLATIEDQFQIAVTTGDADILERNQSLIQTLKNSLNDARNYSPELEDLISSCLALSAQYFTTAFTLSENMLSDDIDFNEIQPLIARKKTNLDTLTQALSNLEQSQAKALSGTIEQINATSDFSLKLGVGIGIATIIILGVVAVPIAFGVTQQIKSVTQSLHAMSRGSGDLHNRIPETKPDEIGDLVVAFNSFIEKLQHAIGDIVDVTAPLNDVSVELSNIVRESSERADNQLAASSDAADAAVAMNDNISAVADNAQLAAKEADAAMSSVVSGQGVITQTADAIRKLATDIETTSSEVARLESNTNSVGVILDVIRGIAEQTNLLALNAAIEAARAGEQGRGFAVVADEVRSLASKTQDSTEEINSLISQLQQNAAIASDSMMKRTEEAMRSVESAQNASDYLQVVSKGIANIQQISGSVANAVKTEKDLAHKITSRVQHVDQIAEDSRNQIQKLAQYSTQLQSQSTKLHEITLQFSQTHS